METLPSTEELVQRAYRFYPVRLYVDDPRYQASEEFQRLLKVRAEAKADDQRWQEFLQRLKAAVPDCRVENWTTLQYDASRRCRVYLPGTTDRSRDAKAVVGLVSILGPVYAIYASHQIFEHTQVTATTLYYPPMPAEFQPIETVLEGLIQASFGFERLPNEVLFTPVPDVHVGSRLPGEARLIDCLFTDDQW